MLFGIVGAVLWRVRLLCWIASSGSWRSPTIVSHVSHIATGEHEEVLHHFTWEAGEE